jgi:hypothetical protein
MKWISAREYSPFTMKCCFWWGVLYTAWGLAIGSLMMLVLGAALAGTTGATHLLAKDRKWRR